jgi:amidase
MTCADDLGAWRFRVAVAGDAAGTAPLRHRSFAVKEGFDVAGTATRGGDPDWLATHRPADRHARSLARVLDAGASLKGSTVSDEFAFVLSGGNCIALRRSTRRRPSVYRPVGL